MDEHLGDCHLVANLFLDDYLVLRQLRICFLDKHFLQRFSRILQLNQFVVIWAIRCKSLLLVCPDWENNNEE